MLNKIIIVEDDPMISEIYQKKFSESGYEVMAAESGDQALNFARKEKVDVILLDLIMPKMDGFEVIKHLRGDGYDPDIKIIVFSNLGQKEDQDKAIKLGADGFIIKSDYTPSDLVKEVGRILNNFSEEKRNESMQAGTANGAMDQRGKKKILLVEDEEVFIEMFGEKLRQDGFEVDTANNGAWGLKEALRNPYDLIIVDMVMPAMTGDEIIEKLKMEEKTKNIPIIAISASVEKEVQDKVVGMGVEAFFIKTQIIPSELSKKVAEILG
jgi:CheY-like chemotaxis protein